MNTKHLEGLIAAPFTPLTKEGLLNLSVIPDYYEMLKLNEVKGAFICGSTGEGVSLTTREKMLVAEAWAACTESDPDFKVMTLLGGNSIPDCQELARHAENVGLYGVSFTAPFYFELPDVSALARACIAVAETVPDLPFYYYHIPVLTGVNFSMISLLNAIDNKLPNFAGIKYTHEDFMDFLSCINYKNGKYDMLWGRDETMLSALVLGTKGAVGSTFNYAAPLYRNLMAAFQEGDLPSAAAFQQKAIDMIRLLSKYGGIATGKAYMKLIGLDCGEFRLPVSNMDQKEFDLFKSDVQHIGFDEFKSKMPEKIKF